MSDESVDLDAAEDSADEIREKAAAVAADGIQSYTHGSRQVNRSDPEKLMDLAARLELRAQRRLRGFVADCDASAGIP